MSDETKRERAEHKANDRRSDDELWKGLLHEFFHDMLRSVLPEMAGDADPNRKVVFRENEIRRLGNLVKYDSDGPSDPRRFVDILAKVPLLSGEDAWILLHVEIQGRGGKGNFPLRMHRYRCLLETRYSQPVAALAILVQPIGEEQSSGVYRWEKYGTRVIYEYPVLKVCEGDEEALRRSDNPFDLARYAGMMAWRRRGDDASKLHYMKLLLKELDRRGWSHEKKAELLWFIEGVMFLEDEGAWRKWEEELEKRRKEGSEMYVSLMERKGIEKGLEQGIEKGLAQGIEKGLEQGILLGKTEMIREMLLSGEPEEKILRFAKISGEELAALKEQIKREIN